VVLKHHSFSKSSFDFFKFPLDYLYMFTLVFDNYPIFISRLGHVPLFIEDPLHLSVFDTQQLFQPRFVPQKLLHPRIKLSQFNSVPLFTFFQTLKQSLYVNLHLLLHTDVCPALSLQLLHYNFILLLREHDT
jgi:hypothetical protein